MKNARKFWVRRKWKPVLHLTPKTKKIKYVIPSGLSQGPVPNVGAQVVRNCIRRWNSPHLPLSLYWEKWIKYTHGKSLFSPETVIHVQVSLLIFFRRLCMLRKEGRKERDRVWKCLLTLYISWDLPFSSYYQNGECWKNW